MKTEPTFSSNHKNFKKQNFSETVTSILKLWLLQNIKNPFPSDEQKDILAQKTGLDVIQVNNWFINARRRNLPHPKNEIKTTAESIVSKEFDRQRELLLQPGATAPSGDQIL